MQHMHPRTYIEDILSVSANRQRTYLPHTHRHTHSALSVNRQTCQDVEFVLPLLLLFAFPIFPTAPRFRLPRGWKISFSVVARLEFLIMLHFAAVHVKKIIFANQKRKKDGQKIFQTHIEVALIMRK